MLGLVAMAAGCSSTAPLADHGTSKADAPAALDGPRGSEARSSDAARSDRTLTPDTGVPCATPYPPHTGPADQYSSIEGLRDTVLLASLEQLTKTGAKSLGYDGAKTALFGASSGVDVHGGKVECVYTGQLFSPDQLDKSGGFNTEHSWPQSEFSGDSTTQKSDLHHLFPGEQKMNSCRGSYNYGDTAQPDANCSAGGSGRGPSIGGSSPVFMVRFARRGDIARAHFYFAARYNLSISASEEATLRCWHRQDPPDADEGARNDAIEALQHNRNPFVDRPEFVDYITDF
jgi:deoxyribonuclease I